MANQNTDEAGTLPGSVRGIPPDPGKSLPETVLVLDGNQRSALATTRSLGRRGLRVIVGDERSSSLASRSKYAAGSFRYPSPETASDAFVDAIAEAALQYGAGVLLPLTDITCRTVGRVRDRFPSVAVPIPESAIIERACNKAELVTLARQLGIDVPPTTVLPDSEAEFDREAVDRMGFPLIVKCAESNCWTEAGRWSKTRVCVAHSMADLSRILREEEFGEHPVLLQGFVPGRGAGIFMLYEHGKLRAQFAHRRLREKPPSGGVSVLSESARLDPTLAELSEKLLDALGWHGIAMVEFRHGDDGKYYLMEINPRLWGTTQLAVAAGVDFPYLLYRLAIEEPLGPTPGYKVGQRLRWLPGDLDHLYLRMRREGLAGLLAGVWAFAATRLHGTDYDTWSRSDRGPALEEFKQYIGNFGK